MLQRLLSFGLQRVIGGPGRSWIFTSGAMALWRLISSQTGRRETIDLSNTKPGDKILIEHLPITHKEQIKLEKVAKKSDKKAAKVAKGTAKDGKKTAKRLAKASKSEAKAAKKAYRKATSVPRRQRRRTAV